MYAIGRILLIVGLIFIVLGGLLLLLARFNIPLGRLPGDFHIEGQNFTCVFPLATSLLLSVLLTVILNLLARFLNK